MNDVLDPIKCFFHLITNNNPFFQLAMIFLVIQVLFRIYLFIALLIHRKDRKELERLAISQKINVVIRYSWKGLEVKIVHPTSCSSCSKRAPTQGNLPPSPPFGDGAGKVQ